VAGMLVLFCVRQSQLVHSLERPDGNGLFGGTSPRPVGATNGGVNEAAARLGDMAIDDQR
jgi:hypothetical protein